MLKLESLENQIILSIGSNKTKGHEQDHLWVGTLVLLIITLCQCRLLGGRYPRRLNTTIRDIDPINTKECKLYTVKHVLRGHCWDKVVTS